MSSVRAVARILVCLCLTSLSISIGAVAQVAPSCSVSPSPSSGQAPLPVTFTVQCPSVSPAAGAVFQSASVDFGDGISSSGVTSTFTLSHTYDRPALSELTPPPFAVNVVATYLDNSTIKGQTNVTVSPMPAGSAPAKGDLYIAGTAGTIERRKPDGTLVQVLYIGVNDTIGGLALDSTGRLFVTDLGPPPNSNPVNNLFVFDQNGTPQAFGAQSTPAGSIAFDRIGNIVTGGTNPNLGPLIDHYSKPSTSPQQFFPTGTASPVKWIDLFGDQCSVYYSFGSKAINR